MSKRVMKLETIQPKVSKTHMKVMSIDKEQLLHDVENFLLHEKRYSPHNTRNTMQRMRSIVRQYGVANPCPEDAIRIEEDQRSKGNNNKTITHFLRALELLAEFRSTPPKIRKPKLIRRIPDYLNAVEAKALFDEIQQCIGKSKGHTYAILHGRNGNGDLLAKVPGLYSEKITETEYETEIDTSGNGHEREKKTGSRTRAKNQYRLDTSKYDPFADYSNVATLKPAG